MLCVHLNEKNVPGISLLGQSTEHTSAIIWATKVHQQLQASTMKYLMYSHDNQNSNHPTKARENNIQA
jgi:hypothetical protein